MSNKLTILKKKKYNKSIELIKRRAENNFMTKFFLLLFFPQINLFTANLYSR